MFKNIISFLALFSSIGTLLCCALPALLVTLGLGASLATFLGNYPQLIWISEHKVGVFVFAGSMLAISAIARRFAANQSCPVDPDLARACTRTRKVSAVIFYFSLALYAMGFFFAFIAPLLTTE